MSNPADDDEVSVDSTNLASLFLVCDIALFGSPGAEAVDTRPEMKSMRCSVSVSFMHIDGLLAMEARQSVVCCKYKFRD